MGFDPNDDSDNDLPDWLKGMQSEEDSGGYEPDDSITAGKEDPLPSWLKSGDQGSFQPSEGEGDEDTPDWLTNIRKQQVEQQQQNPAQFSDEDEQEDLDWLDSLQQTSGEDQAPQEDQEDQPDFEQKLQELKANDPQPDGWDDEEPQPADEWGMPSPEEDPIAAAWEKETSGLDFSLEEAEEEAPDWVSGLPSLAPAEPVGTPPPDSGASQPEKEEMPDWLQDIRQKTSEDTKQPEEVLPDFGLHPEDMRPEDLEPEPEEQFAAEEGLPEEAPQEQLQEQEGSFNEQPTMTGSLPAWLENLQTDRLVESTEDAAEERANKAAYVEDQDVSSLFEDDLPEWLGEEVEEEGLEEEPAEPEPAQQVPALDEEIEKGELPSWLQAIRPLEAVTAMDDEDQEQEGEEQPEKETVGPLSGLRDVLPAEPHIIHFGTKAKLTPGFELTEAQQSYAKLLKSLVEEESASPPSQRRSVANPQQVLRWVIGILLLTLLFSVLWWNGNILPLPAPVAIPEENLAAISLVSEISAGQRVLVAVEYQPGLSGEMEAASAALLNDLVWSDAELVLVSSQPVGPGLADSFLQDLFVNSAYITERRYTNLGYLSGGAAGLKNFAINPRLAKPEMKWNQAPLDAVLTIQDFALVLVITDDPDVARSWVEQVQPLLDLEGNGQGTPLVMVVSAQAEPLVYPYYYTTPRQVSGLVSGVSGGAFYEALHGDSLARRYWDAYNTGLVLAVLIVAVGSVINLTRTSLGKTNKGRS